MRKIAIFLMLLASALSLDAANTFLKVEPTLSPSAEYDIKALDYSQITALETTPKGRLWASVLGGGDGPNGFLTLAYSDSKGLSWSRAVVALDGRGSKLAVRNGQLWLSPKGELWLFYTIFDGYYDGRGSMWAMVCKSPDAEAPQWEQPRYLGVGIPTGRPALTPKGEWVLPVALWGREVLGYDKALFIANKWNTPRFASPYIDKYTELDSKRGAGVYISADEGASWSEHLGVVKCAEESVSARYNNPQIFTDKGGALRMVLRASGLAWSMASTSQDGKAWSVPARFVAAPDQNFAVHRLADGRLLMVRNGRFDRRLFWYPEGMFAYLSDDDGDTWYGGLRIANDRLTINPVVAEAKDGTLYIAVHNNPEWACKNLLVTTSAKEIDDATADYENSPRNIREVLTAGKAEERAAEELKPFTEPMRKFSSKTLRLATYNIQYPIGGWPSERVPALIALLEKYQFDIFGAQEPYLPQIEIMMEHIGNEYSWVGHNVTNNNEDRKHHFNPIFYRKERLELLDYDTIWLTDNISQTGYGARSVRLFTWAKFLDKRTKKEFFIFNGHYDHRGYEARINASYIVLDMVRRIAKGMPAFVTADYNSGEKSIACGVLHNSPLLDDTMYAVENPINAQYQSISGYKPVTSRPANGNHIDHIYYTPNSIRIKEWMLIVEDFDGKYGSDHLPIYVDCLIANE